MSRDPEEADGKTTVAVLEALRVQTMLDGDLREVQVRQLKAWPAALGVDLDRWEVQIDPDQFVVTYRLECTAPPTAYALSRLMDWVRWMLGPRWAVEVEHGGAVIFNGSRYLPVKDDVHSTIPKSRRPSIFERFFGRRRAGGA